MGKNKSKKNTKKQGGAIAPIEEDRPSHVLGPYEGHVRTAMRDRAFETREKSQILRQNLIQRMHGSCVSETWEDHKQHHEIILTGTPSSGGSWKNLKDVPDWRPSLVTRWKKSILSVWRHSLTESVASKDAFATAAAIQEAEEYEHSSSAAEPEGEVQPVDDEAEVDDDPARGEMTRAQKRTKNRALRRNRHRQRMTELEQETKRKTESHDQEKIRKSALMPLIKKASRVSERKSVRFL